MGNNNKAPVLPPNYDEDANWAWIPAFKDNPAKSEYNPHTFQPKEIIKIDDNLTTTVSVSSNGDDINTDAGADVFYVHPTTYLSANWYKNSNHTMDDERKDVSYWKTYSIKSCLKQHASAFAAEGNEIWAPYYRQASIRMYHSWLSSDRIDASSSERAFQLAYEDVRSSYYNFLSRRRSEDGRGVIIAGHSQGSMHLIRLLREEFSPTVQKSALLNRKQLIFAYLVGYECGADSFPGKNILASKSPTDVGDSDKSKYAHFSLMGIKGVGGPSYFHKIPNINHIRQTTQPIATSPITWKSSSVGARQRPTEKKDHVGAVEVVRGVYPSLTVGEIEARTTSGSQTASSKQRLITNFVRTQVIDGCLYVIDTEESHVNHVMYDYRNNVNSFGLGLKLFDYHLSEYLVFWGDIRKNAAERIKIWNELNVSARSVPGSITGSTSNVQVVVNKKRKKRDSKEKVKHKRR